MPEKVKGGNWVEEREGTEERRWSIRFSRETELVDIYKEIYRDESVHTIMEAVGPTVCCLQAGNPGMSV